MRGFCEGALQNVGRKQIVCEVVDVYKEMFVWVTFINRFACLDIKESYSEVDSKLFSPSDSYWLSHICRLYLAG